MSFQVKEVEISFRFLAAAIDYISDILTLDSIFGHRKKK